MDDKTRPEPRSAVMIVVEASWEDQNGTVQTVRAQMENKSVSGACIRIKQQIGVGSKLRVHWRWDDFRGTTKYCRPDGKDYLIGIQRDTPTSKSSDSPAPLSASLQESDRIRDPAVMNTAETHNPPMRREADLTDLSEWQRKTEKAPGVPMIGSVPASAKAASWVPSAPSVKGAKAPVSRPAHPVDLRSLAKREEFEAFVRARLQTRQLPQPGEAGKEKKNMGRKWLELGKRSDKQEEGSSETPKHPSPAASPVEHAARNGSGDDVPSFQAELLVLEDVYSLAGIVTSRKGYSITKVVEMLRSEHLRGLPKEAKRASVLMALDAAGISIDDMVSDAKMRLEAIDSYEAEQRNRFEADWARKAEENAQLQSELESIKTRYMDRLRRNHDGVTREKATFGTWLTAKQQETQNILEAVELCLKPVIPDQPANSVSVADAIHKPV